MPRPLNEPQRLDVLEHTFPPTARSHPALTPLVRAAARLFKVPAATITLVEEDRQTFVAPYGTALCGTAREDAFCAYSILNDAPFVVTDAACDPRFAETRLVAGPPYLRFYAGAPLITRAGFRLGSLCVLDTKPRPEGISETESQALSELATAVVEIVQTLPTGADAANDDGGEMQTLPREVDAAQSAKTAFTRLISHELRTPLNAILGFGELLENAVAAGAIAQPHGGYVQHICTSAKHLNALIEQVLTLSNLERGEMALKEARVDLLDISQDARSLGEGASQHRGVAVRDALPAGAPALYADRGQVVAMLANLITNTLDHADTDSVTLVGRSTERDGYALGVQDAGCGMSEAEVKEARATYRQNGSDLASNGAGLGLGLPLTERLIGLHAGRLEIDTTLGQGTTVWLVFPPWRVLKD